MEDPTFKVIVRVNEETLRDGTEDTETPLEALLESELGWMNASGVIVEKVERIKE